MNKLLNNKYYFFVMIIEFFILSIFYWFFFKFNFFNVTTYIVCSVSYITGYIVWVKEILNKNKQFLFNNYEYFFILNLLTLSAILIINSFYNKNIISMLPINILLFIIFTGYYIYRTKKQNKNIPEKTKFSSTVKLLSIMNILFLLFDFIAYINGVLQIQLILYMPILFAIYTVILFIYKKEFSINSFTSLILFFNIYILSSFLLVLNYIGNNFFIFTLIIHSILFYSTICLAQINSKSMYDNESYFNYNVFNLIVPNTILIFIILTDFLSFNIPNIFANYTLSIAALIITYLVWFIYKIFSKV